MIQKKILSLAQIILTKGKNPKLSFLLFLFVVKTFWSSAQSISQKCLPHPQWWGSSHFWTAWYYPLSRVQNWPNQTDVWPKRAHLWICWSSQISVRTFRLNSILGLWTKSSLQSCAHIGMCLLKEKRPGCTRK